VTRRYVARCVDRARQEIIRAIVVSATLRTGDAFAPMEPADPMLYLDEVERRLQGRRG
jgi:hypothetical protein